MRPGDVRLLTTPSAPKRARAGRRGRSPAALSNESSAAWRIFDTVSSEFRRGVLQVSPDETREIGNRAQMRGIERLLIELHTEAVLASDQQLQQRQGVQPEPVGNKGRVGPRIGRPFTSGTAPGERDDLVDDARVWSLSSSGHVRSSLQQRNEQLNGALSIRLSSAHARHGRGHPDNLRLHPGWKRRRQVASN